MLALRKYVFFMVFRCVMMLSMILACFCVALQVLIVKVPLMVNHYPGIPKTMVFMVFTGKTNLFS